MGAACRFFMNEHYTIKQIYDIQNLVKNRKKNGLKYKDIAKKYPKNTKYLKEYCERLIKDEKLKDRYKKIYGEE